MVYEFICLLLIGFIWMITSLLRYRHMIAQQIVIMFFTLHKIDLSKHIRVKEASFWLKVITNSSLAFGEGYMYGWYETDNLEELLETMLEKDTIRDRASSLLPRSFLYNVQSITMSKRVAETHYNISDDVYENMLDSFRQYSCGWWPQHIKTLEDAQICKMNLICRKLQLKEGMTVLDIGCGWGGLLSFMQKQYGVKGVGLTISTSQAAKGKQLFPNVIFVLMDYRRYCMAKEVRGFYDRVVSVGMFEHVGYSNYRTFFECVRRVIKPISGLFLLHTIGANQDSPRGNSWVDKYIFPGGALPSIAAIGKNIERLFVMEDWCNAGIYYARTLDAWKEKIMPYLDSNDNYDDRFIKMWFFYLTVSKVMFKTRKIQLWQLLLTPKGYMNENGVNMMMPRLDAI